MSQKPNAGKKVNELLPYKNPPQRIAYIKAVKTFPGEANNTVIHRDEMIYDSYISLNDDICGMRKYHK